MPLIMAPCNTEMQVKKISAEDKIKKHLMEIGITEGGRITLLSSGSDGALARKILVA